MTAKRWLRLRMAYWSIGLVTGYLFAGAFGYVDLAAKAAAVVAFVFFLHVKTWTTTHEDVQ